MLLSEARGGRAMPSRRRVRRISLAALVLIVVVGAVAVFAWPRVVHRVVVSGIHSATHLPVDVEAVELNPFTGRLSVRGLRLYEPDGSTLFTDFERLDVQVRPL